MLRIDSLTLVPDTEEVIITNQGTVVVNKHFDNRWENMDLIYCFTLGIDEACVVKLNDVFALPVINHYGSVPTDSGQPKKCNW